MSELPCLHLPRLHLPRLHLPRLHLPRLLPPHLHSLHPHLGGSPLPARRSSRHRAAAPLCALVLALADCGGGASSAEAAPAGDTAPPTATSALACAGLPAMPQLLAAINALRASPRNCGSTAYPAAPPLAWNNALAQAAQAHSEDMALQNYFDHTSLDGRSFGARASAAGYAGNALAENIAAGQNSLPAAISTWLGSPGHCANLMNARYTDTALACASRAGSNYGVYWTLMAGALK
ncbi:MAG: hypothetical protein RIQ60_1757 [Pseudomonadota bacterium]|jgi:uncharacterized protein YkwD